VVVTGRVQGVFFRDSLQREAARRRVSGWVRNRNDGAVEAVFEGDDGDVDAMVAWCRTGPPRARVDHIDVAEEAPEGLRGSFRVRET
jgi:acylphosphatase